jgi:hypothetical protein
MNVCLHKELWTLKAYHFAFVDLLLHGSLYNLKADPRTILHEPFEVEARNEISYSHGPLTRQAASALSFKLTPRHAMDEIGIQIQRNVGDTTLFCSSH